MKSQQKYDAKIVPATEEDYGTEYLDRIISMKVVPDIDAAIAHINKYNTGHSESIITKDYESSMRFLNEIDAAAVYVNASTRFTDGFEFGFGCRNRNQYSETACQRTDGTFGAYQHQIYHFGKWADSEINGILAKS